jgi:hypothetical protein
MHSSVNGPGAAEDPGTVIKLQILYLSAAKGVGRDKRAAPDLSCTHEREPIFGEMAETSLTVPTPKTSAALVHSISQNKCFCTIQK